MADERQSLEVHGLTLKFFSIAKVFRDQLWRGHVVTNKFVSGIFLTQQQHAI